MLQEQGTEDLRDWAQEVKFLVNASAAEAVLAWSRQRMTPDPHASGEFSDEYRTTSLYLDTEQLDVYHRRGSFGRSKYRARCYAASASVVFLERKLRTGTFLIKRRTTVDHDGLDRLAASPPDDRWPG